MILPPKGDHCQCFAVYSCHLISGHIFFWYKNGILHMSFFCLLCLPCTLGAGACVSPLLAGGARGTPKLFRERDFSSRCLWSVLVGQPNQPMGGSVASCGPARPAHALQWACLSVTPQIFLRTTYLQPAYTPGWIPVPSAGRPYRPALASALRQVSPLPAGCVSLWQPQELPQSLTLSFGAGVASSKFLVPSFLTLL